MTTTISDGTTSFSPYLVNGYTADQESGNVLHDIIGRADKNVSLRAAGLRTGRLAMLFLVESEAWEARDILTDQAVFTLTDTDHPDMGMTFVLRNVSTVLEDRTRRLWIVDFQYTEVAP